MDEIEKTEWEITCRRCRKEGRAEQVHVPGLHMYINCRCGHPTFCKLPQLTITPEQIEKYNLPTRGTKESDNRAKSFGYKYSCELDALPPDIFRVIVKECIVQHLDQYSYNQLLNNEEAEKKTLLNIAEQFRTI